MKKLRYLYTILLFLFSPSLFATGPDEEWSQWVKEGARQLNTLIEQNNWNDAHGLSHQNKYVFSFDPHDLGFLSTKEKLKGNPEEDLGFKKSSTTYQNFLADLTEFNTNTSRNELGVKFYVCLASNFKAFKNIRTDGGKITQQIENLEKREAEEGKENIEKNIAGLKSVLNQYEALIKEIIAESNLTSGDDKAILGVANAKYYEDEELGLWRYQSIVSNLFIEGEILKNHRQVFYSGVPSFHAAYTSYKDQPEGVLLSARHVANAAMSYFENASENPLELVFDPDAVRDNDMAYYDELTRESREANWQKDIERIATAINKLGPANPQALQANYVFDEHGLLKEEFIKEYNEKCNLLYNQTGVKFFLAFYDVNYTIPYNDQAGFANAILEASQMAGYDKVVFLNIPLTRRKSHVYKTVTYTGIPSFSYPKIQVKGVGNGDGIVSAFSAAEAENQNLFSSFKAGFKQIPKSITVHSYYLTYPGEVVKLKPQKKDNYTGSYELFVFNLLADSRLDSYANLISSQANYKQQLKTTAGKGNDYLKKQFILVNESLLNFEANHLSFQFNPVRHGIKEISLREVDGEGYSQVADQFVWWFRYEKFRGTLEAGIKAASPDDEHFVLGYNQVLYERTLANIDALSAVLSPFGADILADGIGAIYSGYYGDWGTAALYGTAVIIPASFAFKELVTGAKYLKEAGKNIEIVLKADALYSGLPIRFRNILPDKVLKEIADAGPLIDKIKSLNLSDEVLTRLGKDLEANASLLKRLEESPVLVDAWKGLINRPEWVRTNINLLETIKGDPTLISKADNYYSNSHTMPGGWKGDPNLSLPKIFQGIEYDAFGFPKLEGYSPGSKSYYTGKLVGEPRATDNLAAMKWLKEESGLVDGVDFKQIGDGKGSVLFKIDGKWEKCSWHHHQDGQTLIPVIFEKHNLIAGKHTGGVSIITNYPELTGVFK